MYVFQMMFERIYTFCMRKLMLSSKEYEQLS
jgi:hypothetical protein